MTCHIYKPFFNRVTLVAIDNLFEKLREQFSDTPVTVDRRFPIQIVILFGFLITIIAILIIVGKNRLVVIEWHFNRPAPIHLQKRICVPG